MDRWRAGLVACCASPPADPGLPRGGSFRTASRWARELGVYWEDGAAPGRVVLVTWAASASRDPWGSWLARTRGGQSAGLGEFALCPLSLCQAARDSGQWRRGGKGGSVLGPPQAAAPTAGGSVCGGPSAVLFTMLVGVAPSPPLRGCLGGTRATAGTGQFSGQQR